MNQVVDVGAGRAASTPGTVGTVGTVGTAGLLRDARYAATAAFVVNGLVYATWVARIPTTKAALGLTPGQLGLVLLALAAGAVSALPVAGAVEHRFGVARTVRGAVLVATAGLVLVGAGSALGEGRPALLPTGLVVVGLLALGVGSGLWDVAMNVHGAAVERRLGRSLMPRLHAGFSIGTVLGALVGAAGLHLGIGTLPHLAAVAVLSAAVVWLAAGRFLAPVPVVDGAIPTTRLRPAQAWREPRTLAIGLLVLAFAFTEGTANEWIGVALVDGLDTREQVGALGFGVFVAAMTTGRWFGTALLDRYGRAACLRLTALLALGGVLLFVFGGSVTTALLGAVLWGLGASLGFPVGMSAAADEGAHAGVRVAVVSSIGYTAFLAGPPLIGLLADRFGILDALLAVVVALGAGACLASAARPPLSRTPDGTRP